MMNRLFTAVLFVMLVSPGIALADQNSPKLPGLFKQLQSATDPAVIAETEQMIWRIWSLPGDRKASVPFVQGMVSMNEGKLKQALALFSNVTETAPDFAEGWNKRATVAYYLGDYETSVHDIQKTLSLEPRHFGALSGLALIYQSSGLESQALDVLIQVKEIYPAMPGIDERMQELRDIIAARKT
jgi:tetratricopeptide (TPR) repeat protein